MNFKKIAKYGLLLLLILTLLSAAFIHHGIITIYGGNTQKVVVEKLAPANHPVLIREINILSEDGKKFLPHRNILIQDGLITEMDSATISSGNATIIDGKGKYLIPGLIDSHVHLFQSPNDLLLYVANGVTQVREMIGLTEHLQWKEEIENGRVGPELYVASPRFGSFGFLQGLFMSYTQGFNNSNTPEEARRAVIEYHKKGYDGIKVYSHLNRESFHAISRATDSLGMDMIGHIPFGVGLPDIWNSHQRGIAHFEELMNALNRDYGYFRNEEKQAFFKYIDEKSDSLALFLIQNDIAVTSTLWGMKSLFRQKTDLERVLKEIEIEYVNPGILEGHVMIPQGGLGWLPGVNRVRFPDGLTPEEEKGRGDYWSIYSEACQRVGENMHARGVKILAGTDANLSIKVPGFSLHDELKTLNDMGMTPAEVLRSATLLPAQWFTTNSGKITKGYTANLVILEENPLEDIEHTKTIQAVILKGRVLDRAYLNHILRLVKQANDASRKKDITAFAKIDS